jgi:DNA polymerase V
VCDLRSREARTALYRELPVSDVWSLGNQSAVKLARLGAFTIADFVALDPRLVRDALTVVGARVQAELLGVSCLPLTLLVPTRKGIAVTRCFGRLVTSWAELREAVAAHAARAGEKLREHRLIARGLTVFAHTHPHNGDPWHSVQHTGRIEPTSDTRALVAEVVRMLRTLWSPGPRWFKCGVMLSDLAPAAGQPLMLFATRDPVRSARTMAALDSVNARYGRDALRLAATGLERSWGTRHHRLSPRYTTRVEEMLVAQAW